MSPPGRRLVHVIGAPLDLGGSRRGVDMGPSAVRIAGLAEKLSALGLQVVDQGHPYARDARPSRPEEEVHPGNRPCLPAVVHRRAPGARRWGVSDCDWR